MNYLPTLRASLVDAATRQRATRAGERRAPGRRVIAPRSPRWRWIVVNLAIGLIGTTVGLTAAGVFKRGTPVGPEVPPSPSAFNGVAIPSTVRLLPLRVGDPGGGPPWGLRVERTTRGLTCVQVGRVDFGTVGVLGQDGAFANDGRFHPLSVDYFNTAPFSCAVTDARAHGFLNAFLQDTTASGGASVPGCFPGDLLGGRPHRVPLCPRGDLRDVYFGLLGPEAASITHLTASGALVTTPTTGDDGAYLVVLPHATEGCLVPDAPRRFPKQCLVGFQGDTGGPDLESGAITAVTYRDGHTCDTPPPGSLASLHEGCPPVGFVPPATGRLTAAQLATPITVRKIPARSYCVTRTGEAAVPCGARVPRGFQRLTGGTPSLLVRVSFTSRISIPDSRSYYEFNLAFPHSSTCTNGGQAGPTNADIHAGQSVTKNTFVPYNCPGVVRGAVTFVQTTGPATAMPVPGLPGQNSAILVGRFSFRVP